MSLGPWFKCYPDKFIAGMSDLDDSEQAFYGQIIYRMYENANAIYNDDKTIGRWCNSNAAKWRRVKASLIAKEKIFVLPDGGIVDRKALREMAKACADRKEIPPNVRGRIAKLSNMFSETFAKDMRNIRETSSENAMKTVSTIEDRIQKIDIEEDEMMILRGVCEDAMACGVDPLEVGRFAEAVVGWSDDTVLMVSAFAADRFKDMMRVPLAKARLRIKAAPVIRLVQASGEGQ